MVGNWGCSFICFNLVDKLFTLNQKLMGLDNFATGHQHNIDRAIEDANNTTGKDLSCNFKFVISDLYRVE